MAIELHQVTDSKFMKILPRIHDKIESLTLQACLLPRVLQTNNYPHLRKLVINNLQFIMSCRWFNEKSPFLHIFKQQILELVVTIGDETMYKSEEKLVTDIYKRIFGLFTNLKYLDIDANDTHHFPRSLLTGVPSTTCCSSSIVHLRIRMQNIDDCIYLLDGRLSQLHTMIVNLDYIHNPVLIRLRPQKIIRNSLKLMNNMTNLCRLKYFSIHAYHRTTEFDSIVIPLIRRMTHLEKLMLSVRVGGKDSFIDGTCLNNCLLSQMPCLHIFQFNIITEFVSLYAQQPKPTADNIRRTFTERGYNVDCYIDHQFSSSRRCHVYSLPFPMEY
ncbi:unnamed protein product [Adineta steineri]|uniref:Uncharacterized protein n=2 Tax=Adineta steineri TaxID=433720 RepID=A0A814DVP9_9BILA|nr:unnamed protein product [Adineta steineri]